MQDLVPGALGVRGLAAAQLFKDFLHRRARVRGVHIRGHGAENKIILAVGFDLEAELGKQLPVLLQKLPLLPVKAEGHALEQGLGHDAAVLPFEAVKDHTLVGRVLVDEHELVPGLHQDV